MSSSLRSILLLGLPLLSAALAPGHDSERAFDTSVTNEWKEILRELPSDSIEAALGHHLTPKYREGVFEDGHSAMDAVHSDDPELASKLVDLAKQDAEVKDYLRKRQNNSTSEVTTTVTLPPTPITSVDVTTTTTQQAESTPGGGSDTSSASPSSVSSSNADPTSEISSSDNPPPSSVPSSSDNNPGPTGSTQSGVLVPVEVTTTADGSAIVSSSNAFETSAPTSVAVEITSTNDQGQVVVTTSDAPAAIMTFTNAQGDVRTTAVPLTSVAVAPGGGIVDGPTVTSMDASGYAYVLTSPVPGGVYTVTDARGLIVTVTYQPHRSTVNQLQLHTTTLPNGMRSTITSFAVVGAPTSGAEPAASPSSGDEPNLQSGAAIPSSWYAAEIALVLGAAIGVAGIVL